MQEPLVIRSDPQTAIAIPEQLYGIELPPYAGRWIWLDFPLNELLDPAAHGDQKRAVVALYQSLGRIWGRIEFRRTRLPSPQPGRRPHPDIAPAVLVHGRHTAAESAVISVALDPAVLNRTEPPGGSRISAGPYRSLAV